MDQDLNRIALVTCAAKRIGAALATDLASAGWSVLIHFHHSEDEAEKVAGDIKKNGGRAALVQADLTDVNALEGLIESSSRHFGPPTCLVNNCAVFQYDDVESLTPQSFAHHMDVNLRAPLFLSQAFAKALPEGSDGNIINVIDQRVWKPTPLFLSYSLSKSGLWTLTQTLAQALAPRIRVNAIGPGPVLKSELQTEEQFEQQRRSTILQRGTSPEEIAKAVRFILGSPAMTGQMIALDGGQHLAWQTPDIFGLEH